MESRDEPDPLADFRTPHRDEPLAADKAQLDALVAEIGRIDAATPGDAPYATLLSGGIDSGIVTYLATTAGLPVTPFSVGTPWGDEFADALCAELGTQFTPVHLDEGRCARDLPRPRPAPGRRVGA